VSVEHRKTVRESALDVPEASEAPAMGERRARCGSLMPKPLIDARAAISVQVSKSGERQRCIGLLFK
jgi:hypothetical protein